MKETEWILKKCDRQLSEELAEELELPLPVAKILVGRDILNAKQALEFIEKPTKLLRSPKKLPDIDKAVERLKKAIENKEKIYIMCRRGNASKEATEFLMTKCNIKNVINIQGGITEYILKVDS